MERNTSLGLYSDRNDIVTNWPSTHSWTVCMCLTRLNCKLLLLICWSVGHTHHPHASFPEGPTSLAVKVSQELVEIDPSLPQGTKLYIQEIAIRLQPLGYRLRRKRNPPKTELLQKHHGNVIQQAMNAAIEKLDSQATEWSKWTTLLMQPNLKRHSFKPR